MLVASLAEARIEILTLTTPITFPTVASLAEARIEISVIILLGGVILSPPSRRRGLKYYFC